MDGDQWPDLLAGTNNGPLKLFLNRNQKQGYRMLQIKLEGKQGNRTAVGASILFTTKGGRLQRQQVTAGGSYLSQSAPELYFGLSPDEELQKIDVTWPDGSEGTYVEGFDSNTFTLKQFQ